MKTKLRNQKGFTIIEVLIVLAIAGLIMLIVFLAVPALQRGQRNNARNADASRIAAAISECIANRNGQTSGCLDDANWNVGTLNQLSTADASATGALGAGTTSTIVAGFNRTCNPEGSDDINGTARQFAVMFQLEGTGSATIARCVSA